MGLPRKQTYYCHECGAEFEESHWPLDKFTGTFITSGPCKRVMSKLAYSMSGRSVGHNELLIQKSARAIRRAERKMEARLGHKPATPISPRDPALVTPRLVKPEPVAVAVAEVEPEPVVQKLAPVELPKKKRSLNDLRLTAITWADEYTPLEIKTIARAAVVLQQIVLTNGEET